MAEVLLSDAVEEGLRELVDDYLTKKQTSLMQMRRGSLGRDQFLLEAEEHLRRKYREDIAKQILDAFEQFIFGYSRLSVLIDDRDISDIRIIRHDNIRVKKKGVRMDAGLCFSSEKEYRQFIDYVGEESSQHIQSKRDCAFH